MKNQIRNDPLLVSWNVTKACNLSCMHCYRDAGVKDPQELTFQQGKALIQQIAEIGFKILVLSGGEPLLREDIFDLIKFASFLNLRVVLGSNGTLITEGIAKKLKETGVPRIGISLDGYKAESHDKLRGQAGCFRMALKGIENCRKAGLEFQIHTTVYRENITEILKVTDLAVQSGAEAHHIFFLVSTGRAKNLENKILSPAAEEALLKDLLQKQTEVSIEIKPVCAPYFMRLARQMNLPQKFIPPKKKSFLIGFTRGCLAGTSYCVITPTGVVCPCPYLPINLGNIKETSLIDIWNKSRVLNNLRKDKLKGKCSVCEYKLVCGGCRAKAYAATGDYLAEDPACVHKLQKEAKNEKSVVA